MANPPTVLALQASTSFVRNWRCSRKACGCDRTRWIWPHRPGPIASRSPMVSTPPPSMKGLRRGHFAGLQEVGVATRRAGLGRRRDQGRRRARRASEFPVASRRVTLRGGIGCVRAFWVRHRRSRFPMARDENYVCPLQTCQLAYDDAHAIRGMAHRMHLA